MTLAKGLGGGIPIGASIATGRAGSFFEPGNHGTTFGGNPVACAAALAVLGTIEAQGLLDEVEKVGKRLADAWRPTRGHHGPRPGPADRRRPRHGRRGRDRRRGPGGRLHPQQPGPATLRFAPPLVLTEDDVAGFGDAWPGILREARS